MGRNRIKVKLDKAPVRRHSPRDSTELLHVDHATLACTGEIYSKGEEYLQKNFPRLTKIRKTEIVGEFDDVILAIALSHRVDELVSE